MSERYHVVPLEDSPAPLDHRLLAQVLAQDGQLLVTMLNLIENAQVAIDDLMDVRGRLGSDVVVRRGKVFVFSGCDSHPATGSLQPVAIGAAVEVTKPSEPPRQRATLVVRRAGRP